MVVFSVLSNTPHGHVLSAFSAGYCQDNNALASTIPEGRDAVLVKEGQIVTEDYIIVNTIATTGIKAVVPESGTRIEIASNV